MLTFVRLRNFKSHKDTRIDFSPGVNVFFGLTAQGKTNILKGLYWVFENKPSAEKVRSHWEGDTIVSVGLSEGYIVSRIKTNKENAYAITEGNRLYFPRQHKNEQIFRAFGQDIPREIKELLNLTNINIQRQFDIPFLLFASPGTASRYLNEVAHLEPIDITTSNLDKRKRGIQETIRHFKSDLETLETKLTEYQNLEDLEKKVHEIEELNLALKNKKTIYSNLSILVADIERSINRIRHFKKTTRLKDQIDKLLKLDNERNDLDLHIDSVIEIVNSVEVSQKKIKTVKKKSSYKTEIDRIFQMAEKSKTLQLKLSELKNIAASISDLTRSVEQLNKKIDLKKKEFKRLFPDLCPLCGK